jgi:hypothetical protein
MPELLSRAYTDTLPGRIKSGKIPLSTRALLVLDTTFSLGKYFFSSTKALSFTKHLVPVFNQ